MTLQGRGLRLRMRVEAGDLALLPWELLYDQERREFLGLSQRTPVVRHLPVPRPIVVPPVSPPLRMLVVPASPKDMPELGIHRETASLQEAVQPLLNGGLLTLDVLKPPTAQVLHKYLLDQPCHILHFLGHGGMNQLGGYIVLEDASGMANQLDAQELKVLLSDTSVCLAVLNACLTACDAVRGSAGVADRTYLGAAQALMDAGLMATVAMQFSLRDLGARIFAENFFRMLARRKPIEEAVGQARVAIVLEMGIGCCDWATPVLFLRGNETHLFSG